VTASSGEDRDVIDRSKLKNSFEFVVVAGARTRQLMNGALPRVEASAKPAKTAAREVEAGVVQKIEDEKGRE
jgi:DNA-directed RNA polymerase subunit K/omega